MAERRAYLSDVGSFRRAKTGSDANQRLNLVDKIRGRTTSFSMMLVAPWTWFVSNVSMELSRCVMVTDQSDPQADCFCWHLVLLRIVPTALVFPLCRYRKSGSRIL